MEYKLSAVLATYLFRFNCDCIKTILLVLELLSALVCIGSFPGRFKRSIWLFFSFVTKYTYPIRYNKLAREWTEKYAMLQGKIACTSWCVNDVETLALECSML